ncbi:MAG: hypothetical protein RTU30_06670, partial [Candidatus Thorarchaeota archaeon]
MKSSRRYLFIIALSVLLLVMPSLPITEFETPGTNTLIPHTLSVPAADPGVPSDMGPVLIIELSTSDIGPYGNQLRTMLVGYGLVVSVVNISAVLTTPSIVEGTQAVILDASLGSNNGMLVPDALITTMILADSPVVVMGRASWLLHQIRELGPPSQVASVTATLHTAPEYAGATYLFSPVSLAIDSLLTTESGIMLPVDPVQDEHSRLVDLTGRSTPTALPALRYSSWPLDLFSLVFEDPAELTANGRGLVVNTLAYASALRETPTSTTLSTTQLEDGNLAGGLYYFHQPSMSSIYQAIQSESMLLDSADWITYRAAHQTLVLDILTSLYVDLGTEDGFLSSSKGSVGISSTAQGLWLVKQMGLEGSFDVSDLVNYLVVNQDGSGGYDNAIETTHYAVEALDAASSLNLINELNLELWLDDCIIDGSKTSNPDLWGAIGNNPTDLNPRNSLAYHYLSTLPFIGRAHSDPGKLTEWILDHTSNPDGSYNDATFPSQELTIGTASALTSMSLMGTLTSMNRTTGLNWITTNQLPSGGFGLGLRTDDVVGKTREVYYVSTALDAMAAASGLVGDAIAQYIDSCESPVGYEAMEPTPSMMWSSWLMSASRYAHASNTIDYTSVSDYLSQYPEWTQYPYWDNATMLLAPEYGFDQYRGRSVWSYYFGMDLSLSLGLQFTSESVSQAQTYLQSSQSITGHFKPTSIMGTAHMQHTVAAVEAIYQLDIMNSIQYRTALESAVLAGYSSGSWSMSGWTIEPFAGQQSAIDWLSTRAALRLGIITSPMAAEIVSVIESRLQYDDLWALSRDIAILSLLNSSAFSVDLESIDRSLVLSALGSTPFSNGWYNSIELWQPVFTA